MLISDIQFQSWDTEPGLAASQLLFYVQKLPQEENKHDCLNRSYVASGRIQQCPNLLYMRKFRQMHPETQQIVAQILTAWASRVPVLLSFEHPDILDSENNQLAPSASSNLEFIYYFFQSIHCLLHNWNLSNWAQKSHFIYYKAAETQRLEHTYEEWTFCFRKISSLINREIA